METTNLPQLHKEWTVEDAHKAKKMIACMIYKYVRDVMFNEMTATHVIVDKFKVKQTTTHRQLYGKKYLGGGQTLEQMKERTSKTEKCMTTGPVEQSKTSVKKKDTVEEAEAKTGKGKEKASSPKSRERHKKFVKKVHRRRKNKRPRNEKLRRPRQWKKKMKTDQQRRK